MIGIKFSVKNYLRRLLVKNKMGIQISHLFLKTLRKLKYSPQLFDRSEVDLFDIVRLCEEMPYPANEMIFDNNVYGIGNILKKYSGYEGQINAYIEHGVYFGDHYDKNQWFASKIITFSGQRKRHLSNQKVNKNVNIVGPYIFYAEELFNRESRLLLKTRLKKTLLVFPIHSTESLGTKYDVKSFINMIKQIEKIYYFNTLLVCLFWKDALNTELVESYNQAGFKVCSAGNKWDKDFLNRLKTIICLSDLTLSNEVGTHVGYCTALNKPHTILENEIDYIPLNGLGNDAIQIELKKERLIEVDEVKAGFIRNDGLLNTEINEKQIFLANKYWGNDQIKTKSEMYSILS